MNKDVLLFRFYDLAALIRTLFLGLHFRMALALTRVFPGAGVPFTSTTAMTFAGVDPVADNLAASLLVCLSAEAPTSNQCRHCACDHKTFTECVHFSTSI
jgi:hypothetical protein